ncbi:hypothetical protein ACTHAL_004147 [Priestia flexa]|uniref:Uncharacterized protein n=1 Tax=Priestia veravalensis TaxID=1414648 RepID=A0A0V8JHI4_9BACI|nr:MULTISPECIES: hypothetical protein [Priestia]KSU86408.1 hypothetical protein AS180_18810 [Priestia veravalensis]MEC0666933.1 hypothetical protein [Priestia flexa]SCC53043.1 hypothetical protein GA0061087_10767 [Priestia flexa]
MENLLLFLGVFSFLAYKAIRPLYQQKQIKEIVIYSSFSTIRVVMWIAVIFRITIPTPLYALEFWMQSIIDIFSSFYSV